MRPRTHRAVDSEKGMTVLEIMIVLVILSLVAVVGTLQIGHLLDRSKVDVAKIQLQQVSNSLEVYRVDLGSYPATDTGLEGLLANPDNNVAWRGPYLKSHDLLVDPWGQPIAYSSTDHSFTLMSLGADRKEGGDDIGKDLVVNSSE